MLKRLAGFVLLLLVFCFQAVSASEPYTWPVDKPTYMTSSFGEFRGNHLHNGIDFSTGRQPGRSVYAIDGGRVVRAFYDASTYGKTLIVEHFDGRRSWYSHLRSFSEDIGAKLPESMSGSDGYSLSHPVERGELIARSGHTGSGPSHLHLAIQGTDGQFINPVGLFEPKLPFEPTPEVEKFRLFPLSGSSWINGHSVDLMLGDTPADPIEVWGSIGLDLAVVNHHENSASQSLPEVIEVFRDGQKVSEQSFERLSHYEQDTGTFTVYDEVYSNLNPTQFMVHLTPKGEESRWKGLEFSEAGQSGQIRIAVTTARGKRRNYEFPYRVVPPPRSVSWGKSASSSDRSSQRVQTDSSNFRLVSLSNRQRALKQYSPPEYSEANNPQINLDYQWQFNRIQVDVSIENEWSGWPELTVSQRDYDTRPSLIQVEPGKFRTWWNPDPSRDGWHTIEAKLKTENRTLKQSERIYLQSFKPDSPSSVISLDGQFSLFSTGEGISLPAAVHFRKVRRKPISSELSYVGQPRRIAPDILNSSRPLELTADLSNGISNPDQVGIYRWNPVSNQWDVLSFRTDLTEYTRVADIYSGQTIALLQDTVAPRIENPDQSSTGNYVRFKVREEGSGLKKRDIKVKYGRENIDFRWDGYYDAIYVKLDRLNSSDRKLQVTVTDRAGNTSEWEGHFVQ